MKYLVVDNFHNYGVFTSLVGRGNNKHVGKTPRETLCKIMIVLRNN